MIMGRSPSIVRAWLVAAAVGFTLVALAELALGEEI